MLHSLLHYQSSTLLGLIGLATVTFTLESYADNDRARHPRISVMNVATLSSEDLLADAEYLSLVHNPLDESEMSQHLMNAQWLEAGMAGTEEYREGSDALEELAENAIKYYWDALVEKDHSYDLYTPVVEGNFTATSGSADYGVGLSSDTLRLRIEYSF